MKVLPSHRIMRRQTFLLLVASFTALMMAHAACHVVYVDSTDGINEPGCLVNSSLHCKTLDYAVSNITNSTQVILLSENNTLTTAVDITHFDNISIVGNQPSAVQCSYQYEGVGLYFASGSNLRISNIQLVQCGSPRFSTDSQYVEVWAALYIVNTTDLVIESCKFTESKGTAVVLYDTNGIVTITDSTFDLNSVQLDNKTQATPGGGGLYIEFTFCTPGLFSCNSSNNPYNNNSSYLVHSCIFEHNKASRPSSLNSTLQNGSPSQKDLGVGGGIALSLTGTSSYNTFTISNSSFSDNTAIAGGGLDITIQDVAANNNITVEDTLFDGNTVNMSGGGARVSYFSQSANNFILFTNSNFTNNTATTGGGTECISSRSQYTTNTLHFKNCSWVENTGELAAAVDITPDVWDSLSDGFLVSPVFEDCLFTQNHRIILEKAIDKPPQPYTRITTAAMYIDARIVHLKGMIQFIDNECRGIYANGGIINVRENTTVVLEGNNGSQGGGIFFTGFSMLRVYPNTTMIFNRNRATDVGGAICTHSADQTDFIFSRSCFIQYYDTSVRPDNWTDVNFYFYNNQAKNYGNSIYTSSLIPCGRSAEVNREASIDPHTVFHWKPFHYENDTYSIATDPDEVRFENLNSSVIKFSPGEVYNLSLVASDELNQTIVAVYQSILTPMQGNAEIDKTYLYISDNRIRVIGDMNATFQLTLEVIADHRERISVSVQLSKCPLGFVYSIPEKVCVCSATTKNHQYDGVVQCGTTSLTAYLEEGYWAGCTEDEELLTSPCPLGYCSYSDTISDLLAMPRNCVDLDKALCGPQSRTGLVCGDCIDGYSVFYHSERYLCDRCTTGYWGLLIYVAAELLPLTLFFILIMTLHIKLTSGFVSTFVLFAQVMTFLSLNSLGSVTLPQGVNVLVTIFHFLFGFLNLDLFHLDAISFCLWDGATVLNNLAFMYVTTLYSLLLILLLVWVGKCCPVNKASLLSPIHGISAFILITYAQCAKVSFQILTFLTLRTQGKEKAKNVILLSGTVTYFSTEHAPYVAVALFMIILLCFPPLLLIAYPTVDRVSGRCWKKVFRSFCIFHKLKPLLDSFQGTYKDNYRFFAGLSFLERLAFAAAFAFSNTAHNFYASIVSVTVVVFLFHAWAQPFVKRHHNFIDLFLLADLAIINILSWCNYLAIDTDANDPVSAVPYIQVVLVYAPIIYIAAVVAVKLMKRVKQCPSTNGYDNIVKEEEIMSMTDSNLFARAEEKITNSEKSPP